MFHFTVLKMLKMYHTLFIHCSTAPCMCLCLYTKWFTITIVESKLLYHSKNCQNCENVSVIFWYWFDFCSVQLSFSFSFWIRFSFSFSVFVFRYFVNIYIEGKTSDSYTQTVTETETEYTECRHSVHFQFGIWW